VAIAALAAATVVAVGEAPAGADAPAGCHYNAAGQLVCNAGTGGVTPPGPGGDNPGNPGGPGGGDENQAPGSECRWTPTSNQEETLRVLYPEAPPGSVVAFYECNFGRPDAPDWRTLIPSAVFEPDEEFGTAPAPPSPATVAQAYWVEVESTLARPQLSSSPPGGRPVVVDQPSFFAVANWEGPSDPGDCDTSTSVAVCITLHLRPTLMIDPGEAGVPAFTCTPPGTSFDAGSALSPADQAAAEGACAHVYRRRTGVEGRPASWDARAIVAWEVTWSSDQPVTASGSLGTHNLTSEVLPREVDEVQGVVVDAEEGLG